MYNKDNSKKIKIINKIIERSYYITHDLFYFIVLLFYNKIDLSIEEIIIASFEAFGLQNTTNYVNGILSDKEMEEILKIFYKKIINDEISSYKLDKIGFILNHKNCPKILKLLR